MRVTLGEGRIFPSVIVGEQLRKAFDVRTEHEAFDDLEEVRRQ
jgi:hypothetical protein